MSTKIAFTSENLNMYLKELAKDFRKLNGKTMPAEIILIGGASILANYGFRDMTYDIDAIISASSAMKDAINRVGDKFNLPVGWLNDDAKKTNSFSNKIIEVSEYYRTFSNVLTVRTVSAEYLIAMKLMSGRRYKNDISDIYGILWEHKKRGNPIHYEDVDRAIIKLYESWEKISALSKSLIEAAFQDQNYEDLYMESRNNEEESKEILLEFEEHYPNTLKEENLDDILAKAKKRAEELNKKSNKECSHKKSL